MIGQKFETMHCGPVFVCEYINTHKVGVIFGNTGHMIYTSKACLAKSDRPRLKDPLAPTVFGVGRIGIGPHKAHAKGADTKPFSIWRAMMRRCYYAPENKGARVGVTVDPRWHDFQTFAAWYEANHPNDGKSYQLDKDILAPGNKTYGPEACKFVTQQENLAARSWTGRKARSA